MKRKLFTPYVLFLTPGIILRIILAANPEWLWYDESFSVLVARLPWARLLDATAHDVHPPLYYALLKVWLGLWPATVPVEIAARSLSLVLSLAGVWLFHRVLVRVRIPANERRTALLLAVYAPSLIYHSAEARMYPRQA